MKVHAKLVNVVPVQKHVYTGEKYSSSTPVLSKYELNASCYVLFSSAWNTSFHIIAHTPDPHTAAMTFQVQQYAR